MQHRVEIYVAHEDRRGEGLRGDPGRIDDFLTILRNSLQAMTPSLMTHGLGETDVGDARDVSVRFVRGDILDEPEGDLVFTFVDLVNTDDQTELTRIGGNTIDKIAELFGNFSKPVSFAVHLRDRTGNTYSSLGTGVGK